MLKKCVECGHEISSLASTCPNCGAPQKVNQPIEKGKSNTKTYMIIAIVLAIISFIVSSTNSGAGSIRQQNMSALFSVLCVISIVAAIVFGVITYKKK